MALTLSTLSSPITRISRKGVREAPRMVPPRVSMPEKSRWLISWNSPRIRPPKPSAMPTISASNDSYAALATPRIAALRPGQSPPAVKRPILRFMARTPPLFFTILSCPIAVVNRILSGRRDNWRKKFRV